MDSLFFIAEAESWLSPELNISHCDCYCAWAQLQITGSWDNVEYALKLAVYTHRNHVQALGIQVPN